MNRALPEMLHCTANCADLTILERQRSRIVKWQQPGQLQVNHNVNQQEQSYFNGSELSGVFSVPNQEQSSCFLMGGGGSDSVLGEVVTRSMKPDPGLENGWPDLGRFDLPNSGFGPCGFGFDVNSAISRTASCPPAVAAAAAAEAKARESAAVASEKMCSAVGRESFKKRKAQNTKVVAEDDIKDKRLKGCSEDGESKITTEQNSNKNKETTTSADTSKDNSKASEVQNQKPDYIHVRARRGQATDSHSLAERVRREKISERMKYLQDLVPGCNKITGKAGMLDEIINYVQSLQRQVEFLSMKLATVNPRLDFNVDNFFAKEMFPTSAANFPTLGMSSEMANPAYLPYSPVQQVISGCGLENMGMNSPEMALRRTISAPVSLPEPFLDSSCFTQQIQQSSNWDGDLQNLYNVEFHQGRPTTSFQSQPFTGSIEASDLKMEM